MNIPKDLFRPAVLRKGESDLVYKQYDEICRLRAELEAMKPKPVVEVRYMQAGLDVAGESVTEHQTRYDNLKLTFTDGVLTKAEVLSDK